MIGNRNTSEVIESVFNARSIAVVGASDNPDKFGGMTMQTLIAGGYKGRLYPVNPKRENIYGLKTYADVKDIPDNLDAVVIIVPARSVARVLKEAALMGAKGAIIQSAGFREFGRTDLEEEIMDVSRETGIRIMGPNIQGITYIPNRMCAMFSPVLKEKGPLAIITHSGSITTVLCEWAESERVGISAAVNLGNQVDLCESDYINFFADDPETGVIVLYLEGVKDGRRFLTALEAAVPKKPVVILKTGRTETGARSAASHTGSMAGDYSVFLGICRQYGVVVARDLTDLYDIAKALANITPPEGNRLMIISSSGGAATLASDEAESSGLDVVRLSAGVISELEELTLSSMAHLTNPLDMPSNSADQFLRAIRVIDRHGISDVLLINIADPVPGVGKAIATLAHELTIPLVVSCMGGGEAEMETKQTIHQAGIAVFATPEQAIRGIAASVWRSTYMRRRGIEKEYSNAG